MTKTRVTQPAGTKHKHVYCQNGYCKCGTPNRVTAARNRVAEAQRQADLPKLYTHPDYDAYAAADQVYMLIVERETPRDDEVSATYITVSGNAFNALQAAYALARPGKNDVLIITWVNAMGDKHELSTKVLANRII